jgi:predicted ester cyclase
MDNLKEIVRPFYTQCLTVNTEANVAEIMGKLLADSFQSVNSAETKGKAQLTGQVQGFWKMIPNLKWEPQEILQDGNRVIVRSIASGNPQGNFMGIECDGSKAFSIMTIDIHTVENGQITHVFHVEEWTTGMKQLKS